MKSIIQEASSIAKAIEQGWIKAEKPAEFSVKILEEPQKNFIGLTTHPAKIAIFFGKNTSSKQEVQRQDHFRQKTPVATAAAPQRESTRTRESQPERSREQQRSEREQRSKPVLQEAPGQVQQAPAKKKQYEPQWTPAMVENTKAWLIKTLEIAGLSDVTFTIAPQNFHLRITFSKYLLQDKDKEKQLLASFATLILEMLKRSFKTGLRGHKIVLTHQ